MLHKLIEEGDLTRLCHRGVRKPHKGVEMTSEYSFLLVDLSESEIFHYDVFAGGARVT